MNVRQRMVVIAIDLLLLAQLAFSIYLGQRHPEEMVIVFLKTYLPMVAVTLVAGRFGIRMLRTRQEVTPEENEDLK